MQLVQESDALWQGICPLQVIKHRQRQLSSSGPVLPGSCHRLILGHASQ